MRAAHPPAAPAPRRGPGRPRGPSQAPQLRERLLVEASRLYADGGSAGLSFGLLAARTGLKKATVFHYFPTKTALLWAIFQRLGEALEAAAAGWLAPVASRRPASHAQRLERLIESLVDFYGADPLNARILCQGLLETERLAAAGVAGGAAEPIFGAFVRRFAAFIEAGIRAGEFHPDRPLATIMSVGGLILFEFMLPPDARLVVGGGVPLAERKREMVTVVRRAVVRPATRLRAPTRRRGRR